MASALPMSHFELHDAHASVQEKHQTVPQDIVEEGGARPLRRVSGDNYNCTHCFLPATSGHTNAQSTVFYLINVILFDTTFPSVCSRYMYTPADTRCPLSSHPFHSRSLYPAFIISSSIIALISLPLRS